MKTLRERMLSLGILRPATGWTKLVDDRAAWDTARDAAGQTPRDRGVAEPGAAERSLPYRAEVRARLASLPPPPPSDAPAVISRRVRRGDVQDRGGAKEGVDPRAELERVRALEDHVLAVLREHCPRRFYPADKRDLEDLSAPGTTAAEVGRALERLHSVGLVVCWPDFGAWSAPTKEDERAVRRVQERRLHHVLTRKRPPWEKAVCQVCQALRKMGAVPLVQCVECECSACAHSAVAHAGKILCLRCYRAKPTRPDQPGAPKVSSEVLDAASAGLAPDQSRWEDVAGAGSSVTAEMNWERSADDARRALLWDALSASGGSIGEAARLLGLGETTVRRWVGVYGPAPAKLQPAVTAAGREVLGGTGARGSGS